MALQLTQPWEFHPSGPFATTRSWLCLTTSTPCRATASDRQETPPPATCLPRYVDPHLLGWRTDGQTSRTAPTRADLPSYQIHSAPPAIAQEENTKLQRQLETRSQPEVDR